MVKTKRRKEGKDVVGGYFLVLPLSTSSNFQFRISLALRWTEAITVDFRANTFIYFEECEQTRRPLLPGDLS